MTKTKKKLLLIILFISGALFQLAAVWRSGHACNLGICFFGPNGHDGVWHVSLIKQVKKRIPPLHPVYGGEVLKNYHWGYNFLAAVFSYLPVSVWTVHFRLLPLLFSLGLGILSFLLAKKITKQYWTGFWFAFLNFFASSLGWIVTLIRSGTLGGESLFWSMQANSFLLNPPFALSVLVLFTGFLLWHQWQEDLTPARLLILILLFSSLINIKAYAGILFLGALLIVNLFNFVQKKINKPAWIIWLGTLGLTSAYIFLFQQGGQFPFVFKPFWFIRSLFETSDRLYLPRIGKMWWTFVSQGWLSPRLWVLIAFGVFMFLIGNMGTRLLGAWEFLRTEFKKSFFQLIFISFIIISIGIPLFWVQKGTSWNTIQFFYYGLIFVNFFFAGFLTRIQKCSKLGWLYVVLLIIPLLPSNYGYLKTYLDSAVAYVPQAEYKGLSFLQNQPEDIVLTFPYDKFKRADSAPFKLRNYETTAYVSAFTGKQTFLEDEMNLQITGYPWEERKKRVLEFFQTDDKIWARGFLLNNEIDYVYLVDQQKINISPKDLSLKEIYNNDAVKIYQVEK
jgi:hypothetical protein